MADEPHIVGYTDHSNSPCCCCCGKWPNSSYNLSPGIGNKGDVNDPTNCYADNTTMVSPDGCGWSASCSYLIYPPIHSISSFSVGLTMIEGVCTWYIEYCYGDDNIVLGVWNPITQQYEGGSNGSWTCQHWTKPYLGSDGKPQGPEGTYGNYTIS